MKRKQGKNIDATTKLIQDPEVMALFNKFSVYDPYTDGRVEKKRSVLRKFKDLFIKKEHDGYRESLRKRIGAREYQELEDAFKRVYTPLKKPEGSKRKTQNELIREYRIQSI
jgi:rRNA maturation protein Nop10